MWEEGKEGENDWSIACAVAVVVVAVVVVVVDEGAVAEEE